MNKRSALNFSYLSKIRHPVLIIFLFLISVISIGLNFIFYKSIKSNNLVVEVVDGDTFQLNSGKRVRLMGVDAPEYDRCGGQQAKERLTELILDKKVTLKEEIKDSYGRTLALVYEDGNFINRIILEEGWGRTDYRKNSMRDVLTSAFHNAKEGELGIFSSLCSHKDHVPVGECLIKGNIDQNTYNKFYHLPECKHYDEIVINEDLGEGYFCSEEEAQAAGFRKTSTCP